MNTCKMPVKSLTVTNVQPTQSKIICYPMDIPCKQNWIEPIDCNEKLDYD